MRGYLNYKLVKYCDIKQGKRQIFVISFQVPTSLEPEDIFCVAYQSHHPCGNCWRKITKLLECGQVHIHGFSLIWAFSSIQKSCGVVRGFTFSSPTSKSFSSPFTTTQILCRSSPQPPQQKSQIIQSLSVLHPIHLLNH